jgi:hypothetical protein
MCLSSTKRSLFGMHPKLLSCLAGAITPALIAMTGPVLAGGGVYEPTAQITMPSGALMKSFDISYVDPTLGIYMLGDRTSKSVDVFSTSTNQLIKQIGQGNFSGATPSNNNAGPDGVFITDHTKVWAGDGPSLLKIFDYSSGALLQTINTGGTTRVDEMCWDPDHKVIMAVNNAENPPFATFVSSDTLAVLGKLSFTSATNGAEQCQYSSQTGKFYMALPEVNGPGDNTAPGGVAVINPTTFAIEQTFTPPPASCRGPQGAALGPNFQLALNCNATPTSVIIDIRNGNLIATLPSGTGEGDMVWYNPGDNRYIFTASNAGARTPGFPQQRVAIVDNNASYSTQLIITSNLAANGNHSVAADPVKNQIYMPISAGSNAGICSSVGGSDAQGCIAVFTNPDDTMCLAGGAPVIGVSPDNSTSFLRTLCLLHAVP